MSGNKGRMATDRKSVRSYSDRTLKILFAMSMNQCAHPHCSQAVIQSKTSKSEAAVVGQIAHIYALSDDGPRGKSGLSDAERNQVENLILLCPTHHVVVDAQHESYPAAALLKWKSQHEMKFRDRVGGNLGDLGFLELETAARRLMADGPTTSTNSFQIVPPGQKIEKNGLGKTAELLLTMGAANSSQVESLLLQGTQLDSSFADRLREGFVVRYAQFVRDGLQGEVLFLAMYEWAGGPSKDKSREAAGLCILAHLFIICDVFEK